jgi:predicted xylose isomerase-like sugar epimerase
MTASRRLRLAAFAQAPGQRAIILSLSKDDSQQKAQAAFDGLRLAAFARAPGQRAIILSPWAENDHPELVEG